MGMAKIDVVVPIVL